MKFEVLFWDFDGVIINSDEVRIKGFTETLKEFKVSDVQKLLNFHKRNGGLSRYVKFRYFFEEILHQTISDEQISYYAETFSVIMRQELVNKAYLIKETVSFIENIHGLGKLQFIVSGSDQIELQYLCDELEISSFFKEIKGSPTSKIDLVRQLLNEYSLDISKCVLIGDSTNDYEAAQLNDIDFYGYNNSELRSLGNYIISFFDNKWS